MSHQALEDKVLVKVQKCVLLEVPLVLLAMVHGRFERVLSFASHVTNVFGTKIVQ